jgi:hypothetical protein
VIRALCQGNFGNDCSTVRFADHSGTNCHRKDELTAESGPAGRRLEIDKCVVVSALCAERCQTTGTGRRALATHAVVVRAKSRRGSARKMIGQRTKSEKADGAHDPRCSTKQLATFTG